MKNSWMSESRCLKIIFYINNNLIKPFISMFFYNTIFSTSNNISRSSKFQKKLYEIFKVKYLLIFLAIFILFNYFHYLNLVYWEEPINKIKNKNDSFQNLSLNLMFNRGVCY